MTEVAQTGKEAKMTMYIHMKQLENEQSPRDVSKVESRLTSSETLPSGDSKAKRAHSL